MRADLAFCPLDFQSHHGTLKIWLSGGRFRDRRDAVDCEGDGSCHAIQNCYPDATRLTRPPAVRNAADLKGVASRGDRSRVACREAGASAEGEGGGRSERWRCGNVAGRLNRPFQCESEPITRFAQRRLVSTASHAAIAFLYNFYRIFYRFSLETGLLRRCGNAMPNSTARLQCKFKGKSPHAQRQTHRLESRRAAERNSSVLWGAGDRGRRSVERWRREIW